MNNAAVILKRRRAPLGDEPDASASRPRAAASQFCLEEINAGAAAGRTLIEAIDAARSTRAYGHRGARRRRKDRRAMALRGICKKPLADEGAGRGRTNPRRLLDNCSLVFLRTDRYQDANRGRRSERREEDNTSDWVSWNGRAGRLALQGGLFA